MDPKRFDALTRALAAPRTRRGLLGALGAGLVGARVADAQQPTQAQCGNKVCASNPAVCTNGCVCCVYGNGNSRCRPPGTCAPGEVRCPAGTTLCNGVCRTPASFLTDPANCGGCGAACPAGSACTGGACCVGAGGGCTAAGCCGGLYCDSEGTCHACVGEGDNTCEIEGDACCTAETGLQCLDPGTGTSVCHDPAVCIGQGGDCDGANFQCCGGLYCDSQGACQACVGEGDNQCEIESDACCTAQTGLQCLDPGTGTSLCHDPSTCVGAGSDCDGASFLCCAGLYCDSTNRCFACVGEGDNTCEIEGDACCTAETGLQCLDPGTGTRVCHDPAVPIGQGGDCDGGNFRCGAGLYCDSQGVCQACAGEGDTDCEIEPDACCTDQTGLVCVDPGTGTSVCRAPAS